MKMRDLWKSAAEYFRTHKKSILIMTAIWLLLELPAVLGHTPGYLVPVYYLTGALTGFTGGGYLGLLGGTIARAVIYLFFEKFILILLNTSIPFSARLSACGKLLKSRLLGVIPYFETVRELITTDLPTLSTELFGLGTAVLLSLFLSATGIFRNSFVNVILFVQLTEELKKHAGLMHSFTKMLYRRFKKKEPEENRISQFLNAHALGYVIGIFVGGFFLRNWTFNLGAFLLFAAFILTLIPEKEKEAEQEKEAAEPESDSKNPAPGKNETL
jgi:hypothetical protein